MMFIHVTLSSSLLPKRILTAALLMALFAQARAGAHDNSSVSGGSSLFHYSATTKTDQSGTPRSLYAVNSRRFPGTPEQAAKAFLQEHKSLMKTQGAAGTLTTERILTVPGGSHVRFSQMYNGIPVYHGDVVVSLNDANEVGMVVNNARNTIALVSTIPSFPAARAITIARQDLQSTGRSIGRPEEATLMVYQTPDGIDHLVYRVAMALEEPAGDWEIIVDAVSGTVLRREDRFVRHTADRAEGLGYVYLLNPLSAARQTYGAPGFVDANNADSDSLSFYRTLVGLDSLAFEDGLYKLNGPYCSITDIESPADPEFFAEASPDGFRYTRSQPGFEAVMSYYHVTEAYKRLRALGFSSPSLERLRVDPHGYQGKDNSHYSPSGNWISFGTGGVHDAQDADVIWHEYGHAIEHNLVPEWGGGECGALGEGFGDYWAASHARSLGHWTPADAEYNWIFLWDGHNQFWPGRILNDQRKYPFGSLSVHSAGQIWSAALLGIWGDLGRDITDRLVLKSHFYLTSDIMAADAAQAILQADRDLYGGSHLPTLLYWLSAVKNFIAPAGNISILFVNDDHPGTGDPLPSGKKGVNVVFQPSSGWNSAFASVVRPEGEQLQMTSFASLDTAALSGFSAIVLLGGLNTAPFNDPVKRGAIVAYVRNGGKVLVEGGEVGYFYRKDESGIEVDPAFRTTVLHHVSFVSDAPSAALVTDGVNTGIFGSPHAIQGPVEFVTRSTYADRDVVTMDASQAGTICIGRWSGDPATGCMIAHTADNQTVQTLFLPFAISSVADSSTSVALAENAIGYLLSGRLVTTGLADDHGTNPVELSLHQNYPNPFNPSTTIRFDVPVGMQQSVVLEVFDVLGRVAKTLVNERRSAGTYSVQFDATGLPSGVYFCRIQAGEFSQTRRMMLVK
jgi:zinc metalloprotease ZmpB